MRATSLAAALTLIALAGCGGASRPPSHLHLTAFERRGRTLFISTCGGCHTLADARTGGSVGPKLDYPLPASQVRETIAGGRGLMPAGLLSGHNAAAVAAYVAAATK